MNGMKMLHVLTPPKFSTAEATGMKPLHNRDISHCVKVKQRHTQKHLDAIWLRQPVHISWKWDEKNAPIFNFFGVGQS